MWPAAGGKTLAMQDLFNWVLPAGEYFYGLTISGGEPFQQYEALIVFLYLVKTKTTLNTQVFSGYTLEELDAIF